VADDSQQVVSADSGVLCAKGGLQPQMAARSEAANPLPPNPQVFLVLQAISRDPAKSAPAAIPTPSQRKTVRRSRAARRLKASAARVTDRVLSSSEFDPPILIPDKRPSCLEGITMRSLALSACVLVALLCGVSLLRLALHSPYGLGFPDPWPLAFMGVGLLLTGASLAIHVGLGLVFQRGARLTSLGGLSVGTTLVVLGFLAVLTPLLLAQAG
jgi:hypothetical protein